MAANALEQQPTEFWLYTHALKDIFDSPSLISELASYSEARLASLEAVSEPDHSQSRGEVSLLFLQVYAAADYFTTNKSLMSSPPAVDVNISTLTLLAGNFSPLFAHVTRSLGPLPPQRLSKIASSHRHLHRSFGGLQLDTSRFYMETLA